MAKKKTIKKSRLSRRNLMLVTALVLAAIVVGAVALWPDSDTTVKVTAPNGTTSRSEQLGASEISEESNLDNQSDTDQSTNLQNDSTLMGGVSGTADEN
jgi:hypothetical protein